MLKFFCNSCMVADACIFSPDGYAINKMDAAVQQHNRVLERTSEHVTCSLVYAPGEWLDSPGASLFVQPEQANNKNDQDTGHNHGQDVSEVSRHRHHLLSLQSGSAPRRNLGLPVEKMQATERRAILLPLQHYACKNNTSCYTRNIISILCIAFYVLHKALKRQ